MIGALAPPAACVPDALRLEARRELGSVDPGAAAKLVCSLLGIKHEFGITRVGSTARLGGVPISVVQAVRPLACSNVVSQGKGMTLFQAAASCFMEALETWSGERIPTGRLRVAAARDMSPDVRSLFASGVLQGAEAGWDHLPLSWIDGWDLFGGRTVPVPAALVDTVYTLPSPHPVAFPRTTTGLGGGTSFVAALIHAGLEVLERDAVATAGQAGSSIDRERIDPDAIQGGASPRLIASFREAGLLPGVWLLPSGGGLPVYRCHLMERRSDRQLAPLPAEGFGCDFTDDQALAKALLEACQARVTAIAGAREDITRRHYPDSYDWTQLARWREALAARPAGKPYAEEAGPVSQVDALEGLLSALHLAGAKAAIVVPLYSRADPKVEVVRLVAPPLRVALDD